MKTTEWKEGDATTIIKQKPSGNFTMIGNDVLRDNRLSLSDIGLFSKIMSLPENWNFSISGLTKNVPDGKCRVWKSLTNLKQYGYLEFKPERDSKGRFKGTRLIIRSCPVQPETESPHPENRDTGKPAPVNPTQYKKDKYNNTTNKDNKNIRARTSFQEFEQRTYSPEFYKKLEEEMSSMDRKEYCLKKKRL